MGGKDVAKRIRRINKGKKPHEPVYDPELLPDNSIIAVDVSTSLVPFAKTNEGSAQATSIPQQSVTSVQDRWELIYIKKCAPYKHRLLLTFDAEFPFKDQCVRHKRSKIFNKAVAKLALLRSSNQHDSKTIKAVRKAEKGTCKVTCDIVANAVQWASRRPGLTAVNYVVGLIILLIFLVQVQHRTTV